MNIPVAATIEFLVRPTCLEQMKSKERYRNVNIHYAACGYHLTSFETASLSWALIW